MKTSALAGADVEVDDSGSFTTVGDFMGNMDADTKVSHLFREGPIRNIKRVRFYPLTWSFPAALRADVFVLKAGAADPYLHAASGSGRGSAEHDVSSSA